ncbi:PQQ enzyme repeat family protein [Minicystis rosea]|nr:PQQ enzyme repeat family protein [Minicystis rosea]
MPAARRAIGSSVKRATLACAGLAVALTASGCDTIRAVGAPDLPLWVHHPGGALEVEMRRTIGSDLRTLSDQYERGRPAIDAPHRRVFVGSSDGGLYALHAGDGSTIWRFQTAASVQCEPMYDDAEDVVYFGSNDGALYKVKAQTGEMLWRFNTNAEVARRPVIRNGVVYVTNANDTLIAIDAQSGKMKWHQHRTPAFGMEVAGYAGPALGRDKVYAAFSDGVVQAYSLEDGSEQWPTVDLAAEAEPSTGGDVPRYLDVDTTPVLDRTAAGSVVYVAGYAGGVFALDAENGTRVWVNDRATGVTELVLWEQPAHAPRSGQGPEVPARKLLLASSGLTGLWALDPADGRTVWRRNIPEGGMTAPVPIEGALLVGTTRYGLFLFSPLDGGVIDGILTGTGFAMTPAAFGRRAYVMSNGGALLGVYVQPPPGAEKPRD